VAICAHHQPVACKSPPVHDMHWQQVRVGNAAERRAPAPRPLPPQQGAPPAAGAERVLIPLYPGYGAIKHQASPTKDRKRRRAWANGDFDADHGLGLWASTEWAVRPIRAGRAAPAGRRRRLPCAPCSVFATSFQLLLFFALSRVSHYALCLPKPHAAARAPQAGGRRRVSPCTAVQDEIDNSVPV
jgi:hypothetical protein